MSSHTAICDWIDVAADAYSAPRRENPDKSTAGDTGPGLGDSASSGEGSGSQANRDPIIPYPSSYPDDWDTREYNIEMTFSSHKDWMAVMMINAKDVPALMRNGIHWNQDNVDPTKGHLLYPDQLTTDQRASGWEYSRKYYLQDIDKVPQWVAKIEVVATKILDLSQFRVNHLTMDLLDEVRAWNWDEFEIYKYNSGTFTENYNAIYDDMQLGEGWPQV